MKKIKILITAPLYHIKDQKKLLLKNFKCTFADHNNHRLINDLLKKQDGWICSPSPKKKISEINYPNIKFLNFISTPSTGTTHISDELKHRPNLKILSLSMTKKINSIKASSEYTFSIGLALIKKIVPAIKHVHNGHWRDVEEKLRSEEIDKKVIGIIGFGRIGKNLSKYSKIFGMENIIYDPNIQLNGYNRIENLNKIKLKSDIIFVCANFTKKNINFIDKNFFSKLKKKPYFINTSRGELVEENALLYALKKKKIKGAAIDVIKGEQNLNLKKNKLVLYSKKNENLLITPHIAGLTPQSEAKAMNISIELIKKYFKK
jgi:D-3-phosphoglycerate dehydrogenase